MPSPVRIAQTEAPASYVTRIREHFQREEVGAARRVLAEALRAGVDEPGLANWEKLLAPGKVLGYHPAEPDSDLHAEVHWLDQHGQEYRGQWVAVIGEKMLAHAETLEELRSDLSKLALTTRPLVHFMG